MTLLSQVRTVIFSICLTVALSATAPALAANIAVADASNGYAAKILQKIVTLWTPPISLTKNYYLTLRVGINEKGEVQDCTPTHTSGTNTLDVSTCTAVRKGGPYGTPPYGLPIDVHLAFWTGTPKKESTIPSIEVSSEQPKAARHNTSNETLQRAEALARETEKVPHKSTPAMLDSGLTAEEMELDMNPNSSIAQDKYGVQYKKYFSRLVWALRNAIFIPAETKPGTYYATVHLVLGETGSIKKQNIVTSSGDKLLDKYVLQGIRRQGKVEAPPKGLSHDLDVTLTLKR